MRQKILEVESLTKYYGRQGSQTKALDGISFQVLAGEFLGIMGSSGSGKSTLLNCIATVIKPTRGQIRISGTEPSRGAGWQSTAAGASATCSRILSSWTT